MPLELQAALSDSLAFDLSLCSRIVWDAAAFSASSRLFDLNGETNRARQRQNSAIIVADARRFAHVINTDGVLSTCRGGHDRLRGASFISRSGHDHLFEDQRQRQNRRVRLDDRAAHHRCAKGNGATVLDVRSLHLQRHVFEGVKLQEAVDDTVIAEADRVPVRALHGLGHECAAANMTPHPTQDRIRQNSVGAERQRSPAPDEEAVLREEVGEVAPGPERGRVISPPFAADETLFDRHAEQNQCDFHQDQRKHHAGDGVSA